MPTDMLRASSRSIALAAVAAGAVMFALAAPEPASAQTNADVASPAKPEQAKSEQAKSEQAKSEQAKSEQQAEQAGASKAKVKTAKARRKTHVTVTRRRHGKHDFGFLPGYEPPGQGPYDARDHGYTPGYWYGGARYYRGRWNGGGFGPCYVQTPIGPHWTCG